jgi:hypothetical protein
MDYKTSKDFEPHSNAPCTRAASGVQMDMRIWHTSAYRSVSLRDAAEHSIMRHRFQAMMAAHAAVTAAARAVREARVWPSAPTVFSCNLF